MARLYTPFLSELGGVIGGGLQKRAEKELIQNAYAGDTAALAKLATTNPQAARQIKQEKKETAQLKLQEKRYGEKKAFEEEKYATKQVQYAEKANVEAEERQEEAIKSEMEYVGQTMEESAKFDKFEEAQSFVARRVSENPKLAEHAKDFALTREMFDQNKKVYGDVSEKPFAGKGMEAQTSNILVKGVNNPEYRKSPEYARAYQLVSEPKVIKTPTGDILLPPELPVMFKAPGEKDIPEEEQIKTISTAAKEDAKQIKYIPGTEKPMKFTEGEKLSAGFYGRMQNSEANILKLKGFDPTDPKEVALGLTNVTASENMQLFRQAADDWIRAKLRKESGAVIGDNEMKKEYQVYFPRLGDTPAVIKQKQEARVLAMDAMKSNAGALIKEKEKPAGATPAAGDVISGYRFKGGDPGKQENWEKQ